MLFLTNLFLPETKLSIRERQQEKSRLERLSVYYANKIDYLSSRRLNNRLAVLACRDAQVDYKKFSGKGAEQSYIRTCLRYYKKKLRDIDKELKRF